MTRFDAFRKHSVLRRGQPSRGFTLVEIALVVVIASVLLLAGMRLMIARAESAQIEVTRRNQDAIKTALISYLGRNQRLPCPDVDLPPNGKEDRAGAPCTAYVGAVPYLDLGLDRSAVLDGWENYMTYVVSATASAPLPSLPVPPNPNWTTSWVMSYVQTVTDATIQTNVGTLAFLPTVSTGGIVVNDITGTATSTPVATPPTGAVVVLISYGRDGLGATNTSTSGVFKNDATGASPDEVQNITPTAPGPGILVVNRDIADQGPPGHGAFDDILLVLRQNDLVAPLVTSGVLQAGSGPSFAQANDNLIGQIASTRSLCPGPNSCACTAPAYVYAIPSVATPVLIGNGPITYTSPGNLCFLSTSVPGNTAYTLYSPDNNTRVVTNAEVVGALGHVGGF